MLGGGINHNGTLSSISLSRISYAVERHRQRRLPLIVSGRWSLLAATEPGRTEAAALREHALQSGVAAEDVLAEADSMDTMGNAYFCCKRFIAPMGLRAVEVITSAFHGPRAVYAFNKVLGNECNVRIISPPEILFTPSELQRLKAREQKILDFTRSLFDPLEDGDMEGIYVALCTLPGYSASPLYSRKALLEIVAGEFRLGNMYG